MSGVGFVGTIKKGIAQHKTDWQERNCTCVPHCQNAYVVRTKAPLHLRHRNGNARTPGKGLRGLLQRLVGGSIPLECFHFLCGVSSSSDDLWCMVLVHEQGPASPQFADPISSKLTSGLCHTGGETATAQPLTSPCPLPRLHRNTGWMPPPPTLLYNGVGCTSHCAPPPPPPDGCGGWGACSFVDGKWKALVHTRWRRGLLSVPWVLASVSINHQRSSVTR